MMHGFEPCSVVRKDSCPVCRLAGRDKHGDNMAVYSDGHGYCFGCGTYFPAAGFEQDELNERIKEIKSLIPLGDYRPLTKRKISQRTCEMYGYTIGMYKGQPSQIAAYTNERGQVVAQHVRGPGKTFAWVGDFKSVGLFGQHRFKPGKMVVVTEGEIDCLSIAELWECKWPVVSIPSGAKHAPKAFKKALEWLEGFESVIIAFDMDDAGREAAIECSGLLSPGKAKIATYPRKDANEMLVEGLTKELIAAIWNAPPYRPDGIVLGADLWEKILEEPQKGLEIPWPELNKMTQGIRKGELWLWTGGSGLGKSTIVHELGAALFNAHGIRLGVMALEESVKRAAERYISIHLSKPIHLNRNGVSEDMLREAFDATVGSGRMCFYDHFGSTEVENILAKIRYMVVSCGVDWLILDHISIVVSGLEEIGESERKTIDRLMTALRSLIQETGIGVLAVVHLKRPDKGSYNEGKQVSLTDLRGSGSLEQLSDVVLAVERDQQGDDPNKLQIRVLKNRPVGTTGKADVLSYHAETGRLSLGTSCPFDPVEAGKDKEDDEDF